ncbi:MAG: C25 family cysteine peptidase [Candidatus Eisenbacteria bacterium]
MGRASLAVLAFIMVSFSLATAEVVTLDASLDGHAVELIESSFERTVIEYEVGAFTTAPVDIDGETYQKIILGGESSTYERGLPELPDVARSIIIPDDAEMEVRVVTSHYVDIPDVMVAPSKGVITRNIDPATVRYSFDPTYAVDAWYPGELAYAREPYIMRDVRGIVVVVNPFQYNPVTKTLRVYDHLVLEVVPVGPGVTNVLTHRPGEGVVDEFRRIYERHFLNYGSIPAARYTSVGEVGNMLVIAYDSFMTNMQAFVDWKNQMGVPCEMVSVTTAGSSASNIQTYIQNYYDTNGIAFVLLVGDAAQIPSLSAAGGASDPSFSLVAGGDSYPDIFVGRFSAESTPQVDTQVLRSVEYEKLPQAGGAWYHKGTGIASNQGPGDDNEYDNAHMDNIRTDLLGFTYTEVDQIYDPTATAAMVSTAVNDGRSVMNYTGHGSTNAWSSSGFSSTNVNALTNDNMLPFIWSVACVNGAFTSGTCFGEAWLRATNGAEPTGAIGAYMSSINQSWNSPMCAQDEMVDLLVAGAKRTFGALSFNGSCQMIDEYGSDGIDMFKTWHIFGDPSLRVRTDTPSAISVIHDDNIDPIATTFDVTVTGEEGALCALYYDGVLYGSAFTNGSGVATINVSSTPPTDVDLTLTVTSFNGLPYFGTVHVGQAYVPNVDATPTYFDFVLEPDETDAATLYIGNVGEPLSVLHFDLEIVDASTPRSLTGSDVSVSPVNYGPGETIDFVYSIYNGSTDDEWVTDATLDFPTGVTVVSCTDFQVSTRTLTCDGTTGDGVTVGWSGVGSSNVIYPAETAVSTIRLTIDSGFAGDLDVGYTLDGDGWGSAPHSVSGTVTTSPPAGPTVTLTTPDGGEVWGIGESHSIGWSWTGSFGYVSLDCSTDDGATWSSISSSTENDGGYPWLVDAGVSTECRIRVTGLTTPSIDDASDGQFAIYQPVTWLTAVPMSGDVDSGLDEQVVITADATGLPEGDYFADIHIDSNGGARITVPVALHVQATGVEDDLPRVSVLYGNYPNPFNPKTRIAFALPTAGPARVLIYNTSGRLVRTLVDGMVDAGPRTVEWDGRTDAGSEVASGVYYYSLEAAGRELGGRMVLLK